MHHSIYSSLLLKNDCHRRMRVVWLKNPTGMDITYAYINTIINNKEDSHSTHFSPPMFNTGSIVITDDTHSHFPNYLKCVLLNLLGGHCLYNSNLSISPYSWGSINDWIMKTRSELWQSFSITIWWIIYINITCCPSFYSWICTTYSCIFYIVIF